MTLPEPMRWCGYDQHAKKIDWERAYAQPLLAGRRCLFCCDGGRLVAVGHDVPRTRYAAVTDAFRDVLRAGQAVDGALRCGPPEDGAPPFFHAYDLVGPEDFNARYTDLFGLIGKVLAARPDAPVCLVEPVRVRGHEDLLVAQAHFLSQGHEGALLRHGGAGYEAGKASQHFLRVKVWHDDVCTVVDYKEGRGPHAGAPVWLCATAAGVEFECAAAGSPAAKRAQLTAAATYVNRRLRVRHQGVPRGETAPRLAVAAGFMD
jgi:hypothetical protein